MISVGVMAEALGEAGPSGMMILVSGLERALMIAMREMLSTFLT
jgi:hypothetical protein